jgi:RimJ/RimL family protein N-acetyltransferase
MSRELAFNTRRLLCTPLTKHHFADYCAVYTEAENMQNVGSVLSRKQARAAFAITLKKIENRPDQHCVWAIHQKLDNQFCGVVGIAHQKSSKRNYCGIVLLKQARYKGYNLEASIGMLDTIFNQLKFTQVFASHNIGNMVVGKMLIRMGFQNCAAPTHDSAHHTLHYRVNKTDYFNQKDSN